MNPLISHFQQPPFLIKVQVLQTSFLLSADAFTNGFYFIANFKRSHSARLKCQTRVSEQGKAESMSLRSLKSTEVEVHKHFAVTHSETSRFLKTMSSS